MINQEIARIFYEIADMLEMKNVQWKPQAYRKAARSIESLSQELDVLIKKGKNLEAIPGIGSHLAKKIKEYIETGKINAYNKLKRSLPKHLSDLLLVPGLGPKRATLLYKKLRISSIPQLKKAALNNKIQKLETFDKKIEKNILEGIEIVEQGQARKLLGYMLPLANEITNRLKKLKQVKKVEVAGSVRRRKETIKDIDMLIISNDPKPVMDFFTKMPEVKKILAKGPTKSSIILKDLVQVDIRVLPQETFGSALLYFTGSKDHNVKLRQISIKKGYKLSEYGLFSRKTNKFVAGKTEKQIYQKLNMQYIPPELRENRGEIQLAQKKHLPKLIELKDIKADFHTHTTYSHGAHSLSEMVKAAKALNYSYINITDHAKNLKIAGGMPEAKLKKQITEIDKLNKKESNFTILKGTELNIAADGSVDYKNSILKQLDLPVAGVHAKFKMTKAQMTKRIITAMENEHVKIIVHPTGRLVNKRNPYDLDFTKLFDAAKRTNTILEINAHPERLDLNDLNIIRAKKSKVKFSIGTDSHAKEQLNHMPIGIAQARRGYIEKQDVVNCLTLKQLMKTIK